MLRAMSFRLARSSRARRLLILRQSGGNAAPSRPADSFGQDTLASVRRRVRAAGPQTWVFTGDSGGRAHPEKLSLASIFEATVREACGRLDDVIVDTTRPRDRLVSLWQDLRPRVLRFEPSTVFLELGAGDPRPDHVRRETAAIGRVVAMVRKSGVPLILLPPPTYLLGDEAAIGRQRRRARMVAEHLDVPLIDTADCRRPSDAARLLMRTLGIDCESDVTPVDDASVPVEATQPAIIDESGEVVVAEG